MFGFGKKTYYVNFDWQGVALESSTFVEAESEEDAIAQAAERMDHIPDGQTGTWTAVEETDRPRRKFLGLF